MFNEHRKARPQHVCCRQLRGNSTECLHASFTGYFFHFTLFPQVCFNISKLVGVLMTTYERWRQAAHSTLTECGMAEHGAEREAWHHVTSGDAEATIHSHATN